MCIDRGSWVMSAELALEVAPPFHAFRQREHNHTGQVYSRLLDPRWAEVAIAHVKEQADFVEKRTRLSKAARPRTAAPTSQTKGNLPREVLAKPKRLGRTDCEQHFSVPGARAPHPSVPALLNAMPRLLLRSSFLRALLGCGTLSVPTSSA